MKHCTIYPEPNTLFSLWDRLEAVRVQAAYHTISVYTHWDLQLPNAALRTTLEDVCLSACLGPIAFLAFPKKIFRQPIPENLWPHIFFADAHIEKNISNLKIVYKKVILFFYIYRRANGIWYISKSCDLQLMDSLSLFM